MVLNRYSVVLVFFIIYSVGLVRDVVGSSVSVSVVSRVRMVCFIVGVIVCLVSGFVWLFCCWCGGCCDV